MTKTISRLKRTVTQSRQVLPAETAAVQETDEQQLWEGAEQGVSDDGTSEFDDELVELIETCMRYGECGREAD